MKPLKRPYPKSFIARLTSALLFGLVLAGCDTFDSDVANPTIKVADDELYVLAEGETVIDLQSLLSTNTSGSLSVTELPTLGTLQSINGGLLRYTPGKVTTRTRDQFELTVFGNDNSILKKDTIYVNIETDSTKLPCKLYPVSDYVRGVDSKVSIDVLKNDILCGKSVTVQVYQPSSTSLPRHGTAEVNGTKVVYTPGSTYAGKDTVVYRITNSQNPASFAFGLVYIDRDSVCGFKLNDDLYYPDTVRHAATFYLDVFANDKLCDSLDDYSINVTKLPTHGRVSRSGRGFSYILDDAGTATTDQFTYAVKKGTLQHTALVTLKFTGDRTPCIFQAFRDSLDVTAISTNIVNIDVLSNDQLCDSLRTITITRQPLYGTAAIDSSTKRIRYTRVVMKSDSLQYEICNGRYCSRATAYIKQD